MEQSNENSRPIDFNTGNDDSEPEISGIPQIQQNGQMGSFTQEVYRTPGEYVRVRNKHETIDEDAILEQFRRNMQGDDRKNKQAMANQKKKKIEKVPAKPLKNSEFGYLTQKQKAEIESYIDKYKQYLNAEKQAYAFKQKENLLMMFKLLMNGIFELREKSQSTPNDLTTNEKKIISQESDIYEWIKSIVENYDKQFKEAKVKGKIDNTARKWTPLIKNCKDQHNFELRRKIIRLKIKPANVLEQNDDFLMSAVARQQEERQRRLILNEAFKDFERPHEDSQDRDASDEPQVEVPEQLETLRSLSSNEYQEKKMIQEREKLQQFRQSIGEGPVILLKKRIIDVLQGTSSYNRIMGDFIAKFESK